jgi:DNA-binding SARP family transcriptional activator
MEFKILGPLAIEDDGHPVDPGGPRQRALLAILLLHRSEVVSAERLIDELYGSRAPASAATSLRAQVSRLRKALHLEDLVQTRAGGYVLEPAADSVDADRFERLVAEARRLRAGDEISDAAERFRDALGLWRGSALADFAYDDFAQPEIVRLEELRMAAMEERIAAELDLGRHAELIGELEHLVREFPVRERLRGQLMLALYRSGRQAEALDAYQGARRALTEELGIEPGRPLRELEQLILRQDASLDIETPSQTAAERPHEPHAGPAPEAIGRSERKVVSVVHVQLGLASHSDEWVDPEVLRQLFGRIFDEVTSTVEAHEGRIETVTGDSISAAFGLPVVHEDDAARAVRVAEEIQRSVGVDRTNAPGRVEARIGVSTGAVVTGGGSSVLHARATGEPFRVSARLAQDAGSGEVVLDEATRRATQTPRGADRRFVSPMVGRERERRRLHDAFEQAVGDSSCQLFTILGLAGVGKSRLVREFLSDLAGEALVARGRCLPYGEGITFWPLLEVITDVADLDEAETSDDAEARLAELSDDEDAPLVAQRVAELIGLRDAEAGVDEGFNAVCRLLEAIAARIPLVVVFDDVHWGEETFHDLVEHLAEWSRGAPILLLCIARPELLEVRQGWGGGKLNATSVLLEPLSDDECTQLVANLVGEAELAEEVESRIAEAAEGNPLFVEEMLSMLIDDGLLVREDGRWTAAGDLRAFPVPPTIQALLAARLDQLSVDERTAIEPAAVEGKVFHEGSVVQLAPAGAAISEALSALVRKELIRPDRPVFAGERAFRFRHLMIRDAAYDAISKETRAGLHERHVEWLEEKTSGRTGELDEIVGYHLEQAFHYRAELRSSDGERQELGRRAAERLGAAGRRAFSRSDAPAAVNLVSRAVALLAPDDPLRVDLVPNVRVVQGMQDLGWADKVLTEAVEAAATSGDRRLAAHALVQRGLLRLFTAPDVSARDLIQSAEQAIGVFEELEDELGLSRAWRLVAQAHYLDGQGAACAAASERALPYARRIGDRFEEREIVEWLGIALILGSNEAGEAELRCRQLLADVAGDRFLEINLFGTLAYLVVIQGRPEEASELLSRAEGIVSDSLAEWLWMVPVHFAWFAGLRAQPVAAEQALRPDYERLRRIGEKSHFSSITSLMAQAVYAQGRYAEAESLVEEAASAARPNDVHSRIVTSSTKACLLARRGELEAAERLAREAAEFADTTDFLQSRAEALIDLAEVLRLSDRIEEAAAALREAIRVCETKGNTLAAGEARTLLAELT